MDERGTEPGGPGAGASEPGGSEPEGPGAGAGFSGPGAAGERQYGMPTWLKVLLGCGGVLLVGVIAIGIAIYLFGRKFQEEFGGIEAHEQATETFRRLAREHPFEPPADGAIGAERAGRFIVITDEIWVEVESSVEELGRLTEMEEGEGTPGFGDLMAGIRSAGRIMEARLTLAEVLDRHGMSSAEYVWTGSALLDAHHAVSDTAPAVHVPEANRELAREHAEWLAGYESSDGRLGKDMVVLLAAMMGDPEGIEFEEASSLEKASSKFEYRISNFECGGRGAWVEGAA